MLSPGLAPRLAWRLRRRSARARGQSPMRQHSLCDCALFWGGSPGCHWHSLVEVKNSHSRPMSVARMISHPRTGQISHNIFGV